MKHDSPPVAEKRVYTHLQTPSGAVRSTNIALNALLVAKKPSQEGNKRNHNYHYDVVLDGEVIVSDAWEPCFEACRVLRNRGITGSITFMDSETLKPRLTIKDIEKGAGLAVKETPRLSFGKWRPFLPMTDLSPSTPLVRSTVPHNRNKRGRLGKEVVSAVVVGVLDSGESGPPLGALAPEAWTFIINVLAPIFGERARVGGG
jgi:hypothetical protein